MTGQHFCQAFSQTDKIVICGLVLVVFCYQMVAQFAYKVIKSILFFMEVDESIDISGHLKNVYAVRLRSGDA